MKKIGVIFCLLLLIVNVTACTTSSPTKATTEEKKSKTTISLWTFPVFSQTNEEAQGSYEEAVIQAFEKQNPDIQVDLKTLDYTTGPEKLETAIAEGQACDILLDAPGRIIQYGKEGRLVSLEQLFTDELEKDIDNASLLQACKDKDTPYMYPLSSAPFYMVFNKQYLEKAKVADLVKEGWTVDDFIHVLKGLKAQNYVPGSVFCEDQGGDQGTRAFLANLYDASVTDDKISRYSFQSTQWEQAFALVQKNVEQGLLVNGSHDTGTNAIEKFVNGQASFSLLWSPSQQKTYEKILKANGIETVEVPYPSKSGQAKLEYLLNGFCIFDNKNKEKIEASKKFIQFICDDSTWGKESVIRTGCIPVRHSFIDLYETKRMKQMTAWTKQYGPYYNTISGFGNMRKLWYEHLQQLLSSEKKPEELIKELEDQANETIEKAE